LAGLAADWQSSEKHSVEIVLSERVDKMSEVVAFLVGAKLRSSGSGIMSPREMELVQNNFPTWDDVAKLAEEPESFLELEVPIGIRNRLLAKLAEDGRLGSRGVQAEDNDGFVEEENNFPSVVLLRYLLRRSGSSMEQARKFANEAVHFFKMALSRSRRTRKITIFAVFEHCRTNIETVEDNSKDKKYGNKTIESSLMSSNEMGVYRAEDSLLTVEDPWDSARVDQQIVYFKLFAACKNGRNDQMFPQSLYNQVLPDCPNKETLLLACVQAYEKKNCQQLNGDDIHAELRNFTENEKMQLPEEPGPASSEEDCPDVPPTKPPTGGDPAPLTGGKKLKHLRI